MILRADAHDSKLEPYRHVGDPAWLLARQLFVAEGRLVVERLLASGEHAFESVAVTPAAYAALKSRLDAALCDVYVAEPAALESVTGFNFHRGCLALVRRPPERALADLLDGRRLVALEGVGNPDNVGGIFRTAAALGASGVVLDPACGDPLYRKAIRTSMGATLSLPWVRAPAWRGALAALQHAGFRIAALTPAAGAASIEDFARSVGPADRVVIALGAEGPGLSEDTLQHADVRVRIPIASTVDSLNVVIAGGIALDRLR